MQQSIRSLDFLLRAATLILWTVTLIMSPGSSAQEEQTYTFRVTSDLVQISVAVHDRKGQFVRGLTRDDFELFEDDQPQHLSAVDLESVSVPPSAAMHLPPPQTPILTSKTPVQANAVKGLRLVLLFFDFTSLDPDDAARSLRAAETYIGSLGAADLVAVVSLATELEVQQDFTRDRSALQHSLRRLRGLSRTVVTGSGNGSEAYTRFESHRRLRSLRSLTSALAQVPQRKSIVIFAGNTGSDSEIADITATINAAVRSAVSFYALDARGLVAAPPLGDATRESSYGTAVLSGTAVAQNSEHIHDQDLLYALARGTGGRAFFDSNDFQRPFRILEEDTREYYMLSYRSSNSRVDGRYRRISVRVRLRGLEVEYPAGYYGPPDRTRVSARDVERVLAEELAANVPNTRLPVFGFLDHVRVGKDLFYVPIIAIVPTEVFVKDGTPSSVTVGVNIVDGRGRLLQKLRDVIPASVATQHSSGALQYETAAELASGEYNVRLVVVHNGTGEAGSISRFVRLPSQNHSRISVSPLYSGTLTPASENSLKSPLILKGSRLSLNPLAEYGEKQTFAIQYQVECGAAGDDAIASCDASQNRSSLQCFSSDQRVFEAEPTAAKVTPDTTVFRVEFPAGSLHPGAYRCRVTAVNPGCHAFAFGTTDLRIRGEGVSPTSLAGPPKP
jgi:VWFA-related protein